MEYSKEILMCFHTFEKALNIAPWEKCCDEGRRGTDSAFWLTSDHALVTILLYCVGSSCLVTTMYEYVWSEKHFFWHENLIAYAVCDNKTTMSSMV